eukprot:3056138-Rhodomonas_salina.2
MSPRPAVCLIAGALARSSWSWRSGQLLQIGCPGPIPSVPLAGRQSLRPADASVLRRAFHTCRMSSVDLYAPVTARSKKPLCLIVGSPSL